MTGEKGKDQSKNPIREIIQPFIDLAHAPRALWGINLAYVIEGMCYFGMLMYLVMYFNEYAKLGDQHASWMVGALTCGITLAMFFLGGRADKWGVRKCILLAFVLMFFGRAILSAAPSIGGAATGMGSPVHLFAMLGILLVVCGYGLYQPAAYTAVKQFTTKKTAAMGFAMLYALMNLGGWLPSGAFLLRNDEYLGLGISGTYWVYTAFTVVALVGTFFILSRKTVERAIAAAKAETEAIEKAQKSEKSPASTELRQCPNEGCNEKNPVGAKRCRRCDQDLEFVKAAEAGTAAGDPPADGQQRVPLHMWLMAATLIGVVLWQVSSPLGQYVGAAITVIWVAFCTIPFTARFLAKHPLADTKFAFFIFALIPVQTLFAHNWLTLPMYVERGFRDSWPWISENFEPAVNLNPLLIFVLVPLVTALTQKRKVYNMMILGTFVMAAPAFLLAFGAKPWTLVGYLLIMTLGEAMWQPRFLQYAAEIAPPGRTGAYMGVAQFPWFLTKMIVPFYSGWFLERYCPDEGAVNTGPMWLVYALIAMSTTVILILAKGWVGKDFKTTAD